MKTMMRAFLVFCVLCLFSCGTPYWEKPGIFYDINREMKLKKSVVKGNIHSLIKYDGNLLAGGGIIYSKSTLDENTEWGEFACPPPGNWTSFTRNEGGIIRLAAGFSGTEYLYALTARTDSESITTKKLWVFDGSNWSEITSAVPGTIRTIFGNNAVSSGGAATGDDNRAFVTYEGGILELSGNTTAAVTTDAVTATGYTQDSMAAAYLSPKTYFSDYSTFCSDGNNLFEGEWKGAAIRKDTTTPGTLEAWGSVSGNIFSLWSDGGFVYVGTGTGAVRSDATAATADFKGLPGKNADAAIGSYQITSIYAEGSGANLAIYAATIGTTAYQGTKNNCVWGYYATRDEWNKE